MLLIIRLRFVRLEGWLFFIGRFADGREDATVHIDDVPVDKVRRPGGKKDGSSGKVFRVAPASGRCPVNNEVVKRVTVDSQWFGLRGRDVPWANTVELYVVPGPLCGMFRVSIFRPPLEAA